MKWKTFTLLTSFLAICNATLPLKESSIEPDPSNILKTTDPLHRLPSQNGKITRYDIKLTPYFEGSRAFTFDGEVTITVIEIRNPLDKITLHAKDLKIEDVVVKPDKTKPLETYRPTINPINEKYDFWTIDFDISKEHLEIEIYIKYTGLLKDDMYGFYRSYYDVYDYNTDGSVSNIRKKWMGTTQFQPTHARRAFPCFDEPGYKAVFQISIKRPDGFSQSLSNTKLKEHKDNWDIFNETPMMPAYLIAFIVSDYELATELTDTDSGMKHGIWARSQAKSQGDYPAETAKKILDTLGERLSYKYSEMDINGNLMNYHVSIPDFSAGAMENWGLATYREGYLMYNETETSVRYQQQIAMILSHEIAHFWYGDLVTCAWWSQTWLNEGFARYYQYFLTDWIYDNEADKSKSMDMAKQFIIAQIHTAMSVDAANNSLPMSNVNVNSPAEVRAQFGTVTYNKGASVIRMVEEWIGKEAFTNGLSAYMRAFEYAAVFEDDLFIHLQAAAEKVDTFAGYNTRVADLMKTWTNFNGYPCLHISVDRGTTPKITIRQERFMKRNSDYEGKDRLWQIPITYTTQTEENFVITIKPKFILKESVKEETGINAGDWVIFNIQQSGFYRVKYDDASLKLITDALLKDNKIHSYNKAQIVDDLFNFARENMMNYTFMLESILFLNNTAEYEPWSAAFVGFSYLRQRFLHIHEVSHRFDDFILWLMEKKLIPEIQFEEEPGDSHLIKLFRMNIYNLACQLGYKDCKSKSMEHFENLMKGTQIPKNIREYVYCNALREGNGTDYDFLFRKYRHDNVINEKIVILGSLGCTRQRDRLERLLYTTLFQDSPIRDQDKMNAFNSVLNGNPENVKIAFDFIKDNVRMIKESYGDANLRTMIDSVALRMSGDHLKELDSFLKSNEYLSPEDKTAITRSYNNALSEFTWAETKTKQVVDFLDIYMKGSAGALRVSFLLLISMLLMGFLNN